VHNDFDNADTTQLIFWPERVSLVIVSIQRASTKHRWFLCLCLIFLNCMNSAFSQNPTQETAIGFAKSAREYFDKGDYDQALKAALEGDRILQNTSPPDLSLCAMSQYFIAEIYLKKGSPVDAEKYARSSLKTLEVLPEKQPAKFIRALQFLVQSLRAQGKDAEAIKVTTSIALLPSERLSEFSLESMAILSEGAESAVALNDFTLAIRFTRQSIQLQRDALDGSRETDEIKRQRQDILLSDRLRLGTLYYSSHDYDSALNIFAEVVTDSGKAGFDDAKTDAEVWLGCAQVQMGNLQDGITTLASVRMRVKEQSRKTLAVVNLAVAYEKDGKVEQAKKVWTEMLQSAIKAGDFDGEIESLKQYANNLLSMGNIMEAKDCFEYALTALNTWPDQFHEARFYLTFSLAKTYTSLGAAKKAGETLSTAWSLLPQACKQYSPVESNLVVAGLYSIEGNVCSLNLQRTKQLESARKRYAIVLQFASADPEAMAGSLIGLGRAYCNTGEFENALAQLVIARSEIQKQQPVNLDQKIQMLDWLAVAYANLNNSERAIACRTEMLDLAEKKFGKTDPRYFQNLTMLADDLMGTKSFGRASELCVEGQLLFNEHAWRSLAFTRIGEDTGFAGFGLMSDTACTVASSTSNRDVVSNAAYVAMMSKGMQTEIFSAQAASGIRESVAKVNDAIHEFWQKTDSAIGFDDVANAYGAKDEITAKMLAMCYESRVSFGQIQKSIPANAVLVDFVLFHPQEAVGVNQPKPPRYVAYLTFPLAKDSTNIVVERVDLGEAAPINDAVELVCKRMSAGQFAAKDLPAALQKLSQLVYAPLAPHLTNSSHLIVCPDGQLSRLPFEMLPIGNQFLIEEKTISYVTSGREIVRIASPKSSVHSSKSLVMGNPDFNLDLNVAQASQPAGSAGILARSYGDAKQDASQLAGKMPALLSLAATRSLSRSYRGMIFTPLPGSGMEATNVAGLLGPDATLRLGADAREAELKAVVSPRVLHLATHGFYLPDQEFKRTNGLNNSMLDFTARRSLAPPGQDWENPMVRCGIALAGANHALQITNAIAEDGLLTGLEASLLNLQGTELVILSACDSGTGEVKIGEGVMSLRRAFRIAGAESVLASHWPVSDKATSRLMTEFMQRWRAGEPRAQAWREAQLKLLRSKGTKEDFSNPYFWSAFTLTGQWN
jgi:CHAT domain-containing protein/tetratricopeptide (TPR) repeat protein